METSSTQTNSAVQRWLWRWLPALLVIFGAAWSVTAATNVTYFNAGSPTNAFLPDASVLFQQTEAANSPLARIPFRTLAAQLPLNAYGDANLYKLTRFWNKARQTTNVIAVSFGDSTGPDFWLGSFPMWRGLIGINGTTLNGGSNGAQPYWAVATSAGVASITGSGVWNGITNWWGGDFAISNAATFTVSRSASYDLLTAQEISETVSTNVYADTAKVVWIKQPNSDGINVQVASNGGAWTTVATIYATNATIDLGTTNIGLLPGWYGLRLQGVSRGGIGYFEAVTCGLVQSNGPGLLYCSMDASGHTWNPDFLNMPTNIVGKYLQYVNPDLITIEGTHDPLPQSVVNIITNWAPNADILVIAGHAGNNGSEPAHGQNVSTNNWGMALSNGLAFVDCYSAMSNITLNVANGWYFDTVHLNALGRVFKSGITLRKLGWGDPFFSDGKISSAATGGSQGNLFNSPSASTPKIGIATTEPGAEIDWSHPLAAARGHMLFHSISSVPVAGLWEVTGARGGDQPIGLTNMFIGSDSGSTYVGAAPYTSGYQIFFGAPTLGYERGKFSGNGGLLIGDYNWTELGGVIPAVGNVSVQNDCSAWTFSQRTWCFFDSLHNLYGNQIYAGSIYAFTNTGISYYMFMYDTHSMAIHDNNLGADLFMFKYTSPNYIFQPGNGLGSNPWLGSPTNYWGKAFINGLAGPTNSVQLGAATITLDANKKTVVLTTNATFAVGGIANLSGAGIEDSGTLMVHNSNGSTIQGTFGGGWVVNKVAGANSSSTWFLTNNASAFYKAEWNAMSGFYSNVTIWTGQ